MTPVPSLRPVPPRLLTNTSPEEDEISHDLAALNAAVGTLRNDIMALVRERLGSLRAISHVGGLDGGSMIWLRNAVDDGLSDLAHPARKWIENRQEAL